MKNYLTLVVSTAALVSSSLVFAASNCPTPYPWGVTFGGGGYSNPACQPDRPVDGKCDAPNTNSANCVPGPDHQVALDIYDPEPQCTFFHIDCVCNVDMQVYANVKTFHDSGTCGVGG